jgi:hypothetical protein
MTAAAVTAATIWLLWPPSDIERAMHVGCDGLPRMAAAYADGNRPAFEDAAEDAERLGFASFRAGDLDEERVDDATTAAAGYAVLNAAAYEPPEANNGALVWQGEILTSAAERKLDAALAVCSGY